MRLLGRVEDMVTSEPLQGATIRLVDSDGEPFYQMSPVITDKKGNWEMEADVQDQFNAYIEVSFEGFTTDFEDMNQAQEGYVLQLVPYVNDLGNVSVTVKKPAASKNAKKPGISKKLILIVAGVLALVATGMLIYSTSFKKAA